MEDRGPNDWWLRRWLGSEAFWQNVAIQTVGTLAAAIIIGIIAVFTGGAYTPAIRYYVLFGLVILVQMILFVGLVALALNLWNRRSGARDQRRGSKFAQGLAFVAVALSLLGSPPNLLWLARVGSLISHWTNYQP